MKELGVIVFKKSPSTRQFIIADSELDDVVAGNPGKSVWRFALNDPVTGMIYTNTYRFVGDVNVPSPLGSSSSSSPSSSGSSSGSGSSSSSAPTVNFGFGDDMFDTDDFKILSTAVEGTQVHFGLQFTADNAPGFYLGSKSTFDLIVEICGEGSCYNMYEDFAPYAIPSNAKGDITIPVNISTMSAVLQKPSVGIEAGDMVSFRIGVREKGQTYTYYTNNNSIEFAAGAK